MSDPTHTELAPIAVVGISCRLPGGANSPEELWQLIQQGTSAWSPVPATRFNETAFYHKSPDDPNGTSNHKGGHFIHGDVRDFDHAFFHLSSQQAAAMDPQQRMVLEMTYEAFESAGWPRERLAGSQTSVHVAMFTNDFDRNLYKDPLDLPTYYITGIEKAILSNRISHVFDLRGPSLTLDTACSGGLVALHQACESLRSRESSAAVVAAPNLMLGPDHYIGMSNLHMLSGTGQSYPFDSRGVGYGRGEGIVVLALKRLDEALRHGDPIRTVIRSTAVNQDGHTVNGITYPNRKAQADLIRTAYRRAGLRPVEVSYVEAHGTGTVAGDEEELAALDDVFGGPGRSDHLPLYVGSIKGNIGHTENASGLASLVKATLILDRGLIPPVGNFANAKPGLPLKQIKIPTQVVPLPAAIGSLSRLSINSFGFGGTNAHVILEHAPLVAEDAIHSSTSSRDSITSPRLFVFSANTQLSLASMIESYQRWLHGRLEDDTSMASLSYTLSQRRSALSWRFHCVASDHASLLAGLRLGLVDTARRAKPSPSQQTDVVFVFTGQGAQWLGMGRELLEQSSPSAHFRDSIRKSRDILLALGATWDLEAMLLDQDAQTTRLNTAERAQPATTAVQIALVTLVQAQGVRPHAVLGHSSGEIAAAFTAGHLSHESAMRVAFHRGFMAGLSCNRGLPRGAMMSVGLGQVEAAGFIKDLTKGRASIACFNSPDSVTISGDADAVDEVAGRLAAHAQENDGAQIFHRRLVVDTAYHSHHMQAVADDYYRRLGDSIQEPLPLSERDDESKQGILFVSSVSGDTKSSGFDAAYWTANLVSPVRFCDAVQTLARSRFNGKDSKNALFVEIGPHPALAGPVRQSLADGNKVTSSLHFKYAPTLQRKVDAVTAMLNLAGQFFEQGVPLAWDAVSEISTHSKAAPVVRTDLPKYAWDHSTKHWHESRLSREYRMRKEAYHDLLGVRVVDATQTEPRWRHMLGLASLPWLADHVIDGIAVFPASGFLCMVVEAVAQLARERYAKRSFEMLAIRRVAFHRALVLPDRRQRTEAQLSFRPVAGSRLGFTFCISALSDGQWHEHCTGEVEGFLAEEKVDVVPPPFHSIDSSRLDGSRSHGVAFDADNLYKDLADVGNTYGPTFQGVRSLRLANATQGAPEMTGMIEIPDVQAVMPAHQQAAHIIHPATLDVIVHATLPMVTAQLGRGSVMPVHMDELLLSATEELPRSPGNRLSIAARLTSSHFRTARVDASVRSADPVSSKNPVVLISGIEFRSLGSHRLDSPAHTAGSSAQYEGICYELAWKPDLDYIGRNSSGPDRSLTEVVDDICFKHAHLSVFEVSDGRVDLSLAFLAAVKAHGDHLAAYNFAIHGVTSLNQDVAKNARECLQEYDEKVRYLAINSHQDTAAQGLVPQSFDVVLASEISHIQHVSALMKKNGVLLVELLENTGGRAESWQSVIGSFCPRVQVHAVFHDRSRGSTLILARWEETQSSLVRTSVRILSHSMQDTTSQAPWVEALETALRARGTTVTTEPMVSSDVSISHGASQVGDIVVVADDGTMPILSDPRCFGAATALMRGPNHIIWISPDRPASMHQITGVARTAHAENDRLRLTTIHVAQELLQSFARQNAPLQWVELVSNLLGNIEGEEGNPDASGEREYRVKKDGTVLIPRLHRCDRLNQAIRASTISGHTLKSCRFLDHKRPLVLSLPAQVGESWSDTEHDNIGVPNFIDDENATKPLPDDFVEINAPATAVSSSTLLTSSPAESSFGCAGIVTNVGAAARQDFVVGDRVVAVASMVGSRPRLRSAHVGHLPPQVPLEAGAALLLHTMAACYALQGLARLPPGQATVLVHGSTSLVGRAAIAAARSKGARVVVTAKDITEYLALSDHDQIPTSDIFLTRPSFQQCSLRQMLPNGLDVILKTGEDAIVREAVARLKPFAPLVIIKGDGNSDSTPIAITTPIKLPSNVSIQTCDIVNLLRVYPSMTANLVTEAASALNHLSLAGLDLCLYDISQLGKALRLLTTGVHNQVVLQAMESSVVSAFTRIDTDEPTNARRNLAWENEDACYVVAGGLGDLGRRLLLLMARRGARHFVTLSRRGADPRMQEEVQAQLEAIDPGCRLHCLACDIASELHVKQVAEKIHQMGLPPVRGIIQSAAIFEDGTLDTMTHEDFTRSTLIKVDGTLALAAAFTSPDLRFVLMLSSVASIVGSSGQSSYNAGNAVQDALAQSENSLRESAPDCVFMSLNIGWIEDAAISLDHETRQSAFRRAGLKSIKPGELAAFLDFALGAMATGTRLSQAVIGFDAASLDHATAHNGTVRSAMFCHVRNPPGRKDALEPGSPEGSALPSFEQVMANGDHEAVVAFIAGAVRGQIARLISVDIERIDEGDGSILALGLDSLVAIELRNWISREFDAPLQASELLVDQTVRLLAEKIASRSRVLAQPGSTDSSDESSNASNKARNSSNLSYQESSSATSLSRASSIKGEHSKPVLLPPVPLPSLTDTLRQFQESRCAIDSKEDQMALEDAVHDFLAGPGPALQQRLVDAGPDSIADDYERMLYLGRREPLQDFSEFVFGFPTEAPSHSQAQRAAILTVAVLEWARRLAAGDIRPDVVHGTSLCTVGREWLFYATRQPGTGLDRSERYPPNQTVIVLRRGHIFRLAFPDPSIPLNVSAAYAAYQGILNTSEEPRLAIGTLTADGRDSWAHYRRELERDAVNAETLKAIDSSAFVICLDDEEPGTAGERYMQFLLQAMNKHPLSNRWLDKSTQFIITANGLSAAVYEHAKIDGLDVRMLHTHIIRTLFDTPSQAWNLSPTSGYPVRELAWSSMPPAIVQRIEHIQLGLSSRCPFVDQQQVVSPTFNRAFFRDHRVPPNATIHLVILLAMYLVDGDVRPAWEVALLAGFHRGRPDFTQTISPVVREFIEAAGSAALLAKAEGKWAASDLQNTSKRLEALFDTAAATHAHAIASAARGRGYVNHLYALLATLKPEECDDPSKVPSLFKTYAWDATRRGGPDQDLKIGFIPDEEDDDATGPSLVVPKNVRWDSEGGFLVHGEKGIYVHCAVREQYTSFSVSARVEYAKAAVESIQRASEIVRDILRGKSERAISSVGCA